MRSDLKKINEQKRTDLVGQTERALYLMDVISAIIDRGNNAEVRRKKDGTLTVYEVKKNVSSKKETYLEIGQCRVIKSYK